MCPFMSGIDIVLSIYQSERANFLQSDFSIGFEIISLSFSSTSKSMSKFGISSCCDCSSEYLFLFSSLLSLCLLLLCLSFESAYLILCNLLLLDLLCVDLLLDLLLDVLDELLL